MQGISLLGAICGDIIGSSFEFNNVKAADFHLFDKDSKFTDDTVLTVAVALALMDNDNRIGDCDYLTEIVKYAKKYPHRDYGSKFESWIINGDYKPYNSYGNGSAMRVSAIGLWYDTIEEVLAQAEKSAIVTHNHPEGIKGAQAVAAAVFFAKEGESKEFIKEYVESNFGYNLNQKLDDIRKDYDFDETCQGSVPQAIIAFLESTDYESAIKLAISIGGDSDTIACITGGIASAYYQYIPDDIVKFVKSKLDKHLNGIVETFDFFIDAKLEESLVGFAKRKYN